MLMVDLAHDRAGLTQSITHGKFLRIGQSNAPGPAVRMCLRLVLNQTIGTSQAFFFKASVVTRPGGPGEDENQSIGRRYKSSMQGPHYDHELRDHTWTPSHRLQGRHPQPSSSYKLYPSPTDHKDHCTASNPMKIVPQVTHSGSYRISQKKKEKNLTLALAAGSYHATAQRRSSKRLKTQWFWGDMNPEKREKKRTKIDGNCKTGTNPKKAM